MNFLEMTQEEIEDWAEMMLAKLNYYLFLLDHNLEDPELWGDDCDEDEEDPA